MEKKRKLYVPASYQEQRKAKNTAGKQHPPRSWPLLTADLQETTKKSSHLRRVDGSQKSSPFLLRRNRNLNFRRFLLKPYMLKLTKRSKLWFAMFEDTVKILLTFAHLFYTAAHSRMNSPVNRTKLFFYGFLSDSAEITSCVHIETIIHLRLS